MRSAQLVINSEWLKKPSGTRYMREYPMPRHLVLGSVGMHIPVILTARTPQAVNGGEQRRRGLPADPVYIQVYLG